MENVVGKKVKPNSHAETLLQKMHRTHVKELELLLKWLEQELEDKLTNKRTDKVIDYSIERSIILPFYGDGEGGFTTPNAPFEIKPDEKFEYIIYRSRLDYEDRGYDLSYKVDILKDGKNTPDNAVKHATYTFTLSIIFK